MNCYRRASYNSLYSTTERVKKETKAEGREEQRKTHLIVARPNRRLVDGLASAVCSIILDDYEVVVLLNAMHRSPLVIVVGSVGVDTPS